MPLMHIDEATLESFVLRPDALPASIRQRIEGHVSGCPGCRTLLGSLRELHDDLSRTHALPSPAVERFLDELNSSTQFIRLVRYSPRPETSARLPHIEIQAAMADTSQRLAGYETVVTLASEMERLLLRVQLDHVSGKVRAHLHAEDPRKREGAIVSFPALGTEVVVDEQGKMAFEIPQQPSPAEWSTIEATVLLPMATVEVRVPDIGSNPSRAYFESRTGSYDVSLKRDAGSLDLTVTPMHDAPPINRVVVLTRADTRLLVDLLHGQCSLRADEIVPTLRVRFYA